MWVRSLGREDPLEEDMATDSSILAWKKLHGQRNLSLLSLPARGGGKERLICYEMVVVGFPCVSAGKESACNARDLGLIPGLGRFPGEGKGYPFQYSGLENSMDYSLWSGRAIYIRYILESILNG